MFKQVPKTYNGAMHYTSRAETAATNSASDAARSGFHSMAVSGGIPRYPRGICMLQAYYDIQGLVIL